MVDEAHERSLATDTLLGLLKKVQRRRPELRIIISSATLEVERLVAFFDSSSLRGRAAAAAAAGGGKALSRTPAVISIQGRVYPVQVGWGFILGLRCSGYQRRCALCGVRFELPGGMCQVQVAHMQWCRCWCSVAVDSESLPVQLSASQAVRFLSGFW